MPGFNEIAKLIPYVIRYEGIHFLLWRMVEKCFEPLGVLRMVRLFEKDLTQPLNEYKAKTHLTIKAASDSDLEQVVRLMWGLPSEIKTPVLLNDYRTLVMKMLKKKRLGKQICFVGKVREEVIHYNCIYFKRVKNATEDRRLVQLKNDEAQFNNAFTMEGFRGKGVHTAVQFEMLKYLQRLGYRKVYTYGPANNKSSFKTHRRLLWKSAGIIVYFIPKGRTEAVVWRVIGKARPPLVPM